MQRLSNAKIVATLGPASGDCATIEALVRAGADVFRLNFSHGTQADHRQRPWSRTPAQARRRCASPANVRVHPLSA
ncbi:MAG TPA: pyruvate kinase [Burkholderiaceae bacterium]|nr:pyruvate kinase [Burkholderiaceae bacterium]